MSTQGDKNTKILSIIKHNLDILDEKKTEYAQRFGDEASHKAFLATQAIHIPLLNLFEKLQENKNYSLADFKKEAQEFIKSDTFKTNFDVINTPRKAQIKAAILNIIFALSTLFVVGFAIKKCITGNFFFQTNTDGANKVDTLSKSIENAPN